MNNDKEKDFDDLFKKKLEDSVDHIGYNGADWDALEQMLDKQKKRRGIVYWLPVIGSAAALLLLFLGYIAFMPNGKNTHNQPGNTQAINQPKKDTGIKGGPIRQQKNYQTQKKLISAGIAKSINNGKQGSDHNPFLPESAANGPRPTTGPDKPVVNDLVYNRSNEALFVFSHAPVFEKEQVIAPSIGAGGLQPKNAVVVTPENKKNLTKIKPQGYRSQFAISVLAAPDINGVGSFQQAKVGTNEGLLFSAGVSKKLTISTGVIYSVKPYITGFENYHTPYQFVVNPQNVTADCRMLDIPLNIGYQVYNKHQNKISFGTGLSSYIMLHESYKFNYNSTNPYQTGPSTYTVPSPNKYFFGVFNLNATFEHQVNSKFGISAQPYFKLPLTNIGYSQVRLQTTGVAIGLTWNINSLAKP